jgi:hypothetical protein
LKILWPCPVFGFFCPLFEFILLIYLFIFYKFHYNNYFYFFNKKNLANIFLWDTNKFFRKNHLKQKKKLSPVWSQLNFSARQ